MWNNVGGVEQPLPYPIGTNTYLLFSFPLKIKRFSTLTKINILALKSIHDIQSSLKGCRVISNENSIIK